MPLFLFFFSSRRRHTRFDCDWSSDVCSNQLSFDAGRLERREFITGFTLAKEVTLGLHAPVSVALGAAFRRETYKITAGGKAPAGAGGRLWHGTAGTGRISGEAAGVKLSP